MPQTPDLEASFPARSPVRDFSLIFGQASTSEPGFQEEWEHQFELGLPLLVSAARERVRLYLSEHKGDARPNALIHLSVDDLDAVSKTFGIHVDEDGLAGYSPAQGSFRNDGARNARADGRLTSSLVRV